MFGLVNLVVAAERDLRDRTMNAHSESNSELKAWLWRHKVLLLAAGMLAGFIVGWGGV